jgi:hypothetical protein
MSHYFKDMNLPRHTLNIRLIFDLILLQNLDSHFLPREDVRAEPDLAERALPQRPAFIKVIINARTYPLYSDRFNDC